MSAAYCDLNAMMFVWGFVGFCGGVMATAILVFFLGAR